MRHLLVFLSLLLIITVGVTGCGSPVALPWQLMSLHVEQAWDLSKGQGETIAFIDTGIAPPILKEYAGRIVAPHNVFTNSSIVVDHNGHGTEMITAACGSGFDGIWGVAPKASIMPILAVRPNGFTSANTLADGVNWAVAHHATIINLSLGSATPNKFVTEAIRTAMKKHIIVVAAAGDYGDPGLLFPANIQGVVSVEAQGAAGHLLLSSNYSNSASVQVPGLDMPVLSIDVHGNITKKTISGTSVAAAITSGIIALALSLDRQHQPTSQLLVNDLKESYGIGTYHIVDIPKFLNIMKEWGSKQ